MSQPTPALVQHQRNGALWWGAILTLIGFLSNFLYFLNAPGEMIFPWINFLLPIIGILLLLAGLKRAFGQPQIFRGKISGIILTVLALPIVLLSTWLFFHARELPGSSHAPKVGQKAPDFTLVDIHNQQVSLSQLLTNPIEGTGKAPKAVLLVFYRGYW